MKSPPESGKKKKRLTGCGIVALILLALVITAGVTISLFVGKAKKTEQALLDLYGEAGAYVPAADGAIAGERVEAFVRVREQVFAHCPEFQENVGEFLRLDSLENDDTLPKKVVAREGLGGLKKMFQLGPAFIRFMETRNQALLDEEMGLGEYFYLYFVAYHEQLGRIDDSRFAGVEQAYPGGRARSDMIRIMENQLDWLTSDHDASTDTGWTEDQSPADMESLAAELRAEIAALNLNQHTLPWQGGLPPAIATSLTPYQESLAQYYCAGIARIEMMQKNKGLNINN